MSFTKRVVSRPVTVVIIFALVICVAAVMVPNIPIELFPDIDMPTIMVITQYDGAGPEEVEESVTDVLEGQLSGVSGIQEMTSQSSEGYSLITLEFKWGSDLDTATNDVRDKLEMAKNILPDNAENPQIFKFDSDSMPIMYIAVKGDRSQDELKQIAEDTVESRLEQVAGVAMASTSGGRDQVVRVEVSQNRLEALDLSLTGIASTIAYQNYDTGAGDMKEGSFEYQVRSTGELKSLDELRSMVIAEAGSNPVRKIQLSDVADVFMGYDDADSKVYINGEPGVYIYLQKQSGANTVTTSKAIKKQLKKIEQILPEDVTLEIINDNTEMINTTVRQVASSLLQGMILAMLVLFLFLRNIRSTLIIGLSIPLALLITIGAMYLGGLKLNLFSLTGLILGLGMIVDCSIVVLENIYQYRERGAQSVPASVLGTQEMINSITASILTSVFIFVPMILFKSQLQMLGVLFTDLSFSVIIALLASLLIAVTLVPVLTSKFIPLHTRNYYPVKNRFFAKIDNIMEKGLKGLENGYKAALTYLLKHKRLTILFIALVFIGAVALIPGMGINFAPTASEDSVTIEVKLPLGTRLEETEAMMHQLRLIAEKEIDGYETIVMRAGSGGFLSSATSYEGSLQINLPDLGEQTDDTETVKQKMRAHFKDFPQAEFSFSAGHMSVGSSQPIDILVKSDDMDAAVSTAEDILAVLKDDIPDAIEPSMDYNEGLPEIQIVIDKNRAYEFSLNAYSIGKEIEAAVNGITASTYTTGGDEYEVLVILREEDRSSVPDLEKIFVVNSKGERISVANFAAIEKGTGPVTINREDQIRTIHVQAALNPGATLNTVMADIQKQIDAKIVPNEEVIIEYGGDYDDMNELMKKFGLVILLAAVLVFGIIAAQFESLKAPFVVIFTLPLMLIGVVAIYKIAGSSFTLFSAIGLIVLVGIVVNNGIVLVDYTSLLRRRGYSLTDACIEAGRSRLRPILMTSLTTILGMAPMAFSTKGGSDLVKPIGQTIVGGMTASTLMTLFLIPVLYAIVYRKSPVPVKRRRFVKKSAEIREGIV